MVSSQEKGTLKIVSPSPKKEHGIKSFQEKGILSVLQPL